MSNNISFDFEVYDDGAASFRFGWRHSDSMNGRVLQGRVVSEGVAFVANVTGSCTVENPVIRGEGDCIDHIRYVR